MTVMRAVLREGGRICSFRALYHWLSHKEERVFLPDIENMICSG